MVWRLGRGGRGTGVAPTEPCVAEAEGAVGVRSGPGFVGRGSGRVRREVVLVAGRAGVSASGFCGAFGGVYGKVSSGVMCGVRSLR